MYIELTMIHPVKNLNKHHLKVMELNERLHKDIAVKDKSLSRWFKAGIEVEVHDYN